MDDRTRRLAAVRRQQPDRIPIAMGMGCWDEYGHAAACELMQAHPLLWPGFTPPAAGTPRGDPAPWRRAGERWVDSWGCPWETVIHGFTGAVVEHPLHDWGRLADYRRPDPTCQEGWGAIDWAQQQQRVADQRARGRLAQGALRHGWCFLTATYLRGYEDLLMDMVDEDEHLEPFFAMIEDFAAEQVRRWLDCGVEWLRFPEDLGMQQGPMLAPGQFRQWILPIYRRRMLPAAEAGVVVYVHADGDLRSLAEDLLSCPIDVLNLQDLVNGIDWIRDHLKGRVCIDLDIDRQDITVRGSPRQIDEHIHRCVEELGDPAGGLMLSASIYPGVPLANAWALADALERYCTLPAFSGGRGF